MIDLIKCKYCGREVHPKGMGPHLTAHKDEIEAEKQAAKIPKWRRRTPVFTDGQSGIRVPRKQIERGWKHGS